MNATYLRPRLAPPKGPKVGSRAWLVLRESWVLPHPDFGAMDGYTYNEQADIHRQWHQNYPRLPQSGCFGQPFLGLQYMGGEPKPPVPPRDWLGLYSRGLILAVMALGGYVVWLVVGR